jgi:S1-C subfamily serine protease
MRRAVFFAMMVGLLALIAAVSQAAGQDLSALVSNTKDAVAYVTGYDAEGKLMKNANGVFISPEGHLMTHRSVVLGPSKLLIRTGANHDYPVKAVLAEDKTADLVKLLVDPPGAPWPFLRLAAAPPSLGSRVLVVGYSKKMESTVDEGMVSSIREFLGRKVVQFSAAIPSGAEGAAVVNMKGELVGVGGSGSSEGRSINFAVPVPPEMVRAAIPQAFADWAAAHLDEAFESYLSRAAREIQKKDKEWSITYSLRAAKLKPDNAQAHYYLGLSYLLAQRQKDAENELEILKKLDAKLADKLKAAMPSAAKAGGEGALPDLIKKVKPAIVFVGVLDKQGRVRSTGSGFFINAKGDFITNYHVLRGASQARLKTVDGKVYPVTKVLAEDEAADLILASAVTDVEMPSLQVTGVAPQIGERVLVLGNPKGLEWTAADGIVSALRTKDKKKFIQISAPISPGSSGSPAMNMQGQVIGVNTFYLEGGQALNFASASQNILALKPGPGLTLEDRALGWLAEARDLVNLGRRARQEKNFKKAAELFYEAKKAYPELPDPYMELVLLFLTVKDVDAANQELAALRRVDPRLAEELVKAIDEAAKKGKGKRRR